MQFVRYEGGVAINRCIHPTSSLAADSIYGAVWDVVYSGVTTAFSAVTATDSAVRVLLVY